jgi:hypothetical protein
MKKLNTILMAISAAIVIISMSSCKKYEDDGIPPTNFEEITAYDIEQVTGTMSSERILSTDVSGHLLNVGDIIVYETSKDRFGKMQIISINDLNNYLLTVSAVTYKNRGAVYDQDSQLEVRGTWDMDLDKMNEGGSNPDFFWERDTDFDTYLTPMNGAKFSMYIL